MVKRGWASGPQTEEELEKLIGKLWVPSKRSGVCQKAKLREIDNLSAYGVNQAAEAPLRYKGEKDFRE